MNNPCFALDEIKNYKNLSRRDTQTISRVVRHYVDLHCPDLSGPAAANRAEAAEDQLYCLINTGQIKCRLHVCRSLFFLSRGLPIPQPPQR